MIASERCRVKRDGRKALKRLTLLLAGAAALFATGCGFTANTLPAPPVPVAGPAPTPPPAPPQQPASHNSWTWVAGDTMGDHAGVYGVQGIAAAANTPGGRSGGASWTDTSGNFWLFGGPSVPAGAGDTVLNDQWRQQLS